MRKANTDRIVGITFLALSVLIWYLTKHVSMSHNVVRYGPEFFPKIVDIIMFMLALVLIIKDVIRPKRKEDKPIKNITLLKVFGLIATMFIYILIMKPLGYLISTIIAFAITLVLFGVKKKTFFFVFSFVFPIFILILFESVLKLKLP